jgi:hypothetical protein
MNWNWIWSWSWKWTVDKKKNKRNLIINNNQWKQRGASVSLLSKLVEYFYMLWCYIFSSSFPLLPLYPLIYLFSNSLCESTYVLLDWVMRECTYGSHAHTRARTHTHTHTQMHTHTQIHTHAQMHTHTHTHTQIHTHTHTHTHIWLNCEQKCKVITNLSANTKSLKSRTVQNA